MLNVDAKPTPVFPTGNVCQCCGLAFLIFNGVCSLLDILLHSDVQNSNCLIFVSPRSSLSIFEAADEILLDQLFGLLTILKSGAISDSPILYNSIL